MSSEWLAVTYEVLVLHVYDDQECLSYLEFFMSTTVNSANNKSSFTAADQVFLVLWLSMMVQDVNDTFRLHVLDDKAYDEDWLLPDNQECSSQALLHRMKTWWDMA